MTSNGRTAPQPRALSKMPIWTSQSSRESPRPSRREMRSPNEGTATTSTRVMGGASRGLRELRGRRGLEDRPADLGAEARLVRGVAGADEVVLSHRAFDPDLPLAHRRAEHSLGTVHNVYGPSC